MGRVARRPGCSRTWSRRSRCAAVRRRDWSRRRRSGCAAGTAPLDPGRFAERVVLFARRDRFEAAVAAVEFEEVEVGEAAADVVAVAVVGSADLAQLGEAVEEVRRVGADEVEVGLEAGDRVFGVGECPARRAARTAGSVPSSSAVSLAKPWRRTVRRRFLKTGTAFESTGRNSARKGARFLGRRLRGVDQRFDVVEGGAQVDEGRVGLAEGRRQQLQALVEGGVLAGDRAEGRVGVGDRAGELRRRVRRPSCPACSS